VVTVKGSVFWDVVTYSCFNRLLAYFPYFEKIKIGL
jgi:hypothetical protein